MLASDRIVDFIDVEHRNSFRVIATLKSGAETQYPADPKSRLRFSDIDTVAQARLMTKINSRVCPVKRSDNE